MFENVLIVLVNDYFDHSLCFTCMVSVIITYNLKSVPFKFVEQNNKT